MVEVINLTPHAVNMVRETEDSFEIVKVFEPSGVEARCTTETETVGDVNGFPIKKTVFGEPCIVLPSGSTMALPEYDPLHKMYIVSALTARAAERSDFIVPNETVRDVNGRIIGCKSFGKV